MHVLILSDEILHYLCEPTSSIKLYVYIRADTVNQRTGLGFAIFAVSAAFSLDKYFLKIYSALRSCKLPVKEMESSFELKR